MPSVLRKTLHPRLSHYVQEILDCLSSGASHQQILPDYPQLEPEDFRAVYAYAAERGER